MEDAHVALPVPEGTGVDAFFGVFDGHGGSRAAEWVSHNMYSALLNADAFKEGDMARAMHQAFASIEDQFLQIAMYVHPRPILHRTHHTHTVLHTHTHTYALDTD